MVELVSDCMGFANYGMKREVMVHKDCFKDFSSTMNNIMVLFSLYSYSSKYTNNYLQSYSLHYLKLMKDNDRAFTITIYNNVDDVYSTLDVQLSYHFHNDFNKHKEYQRIFDKSFDGIGIRQDNHVKLESKEDIMLGLKTFANIVLI